MQITVRAIPADELVGLSPAAIAARLLADPDGDAVGFGQVVGIDEAWRSDSLIEHTAFIDDLGALGADATPLLTALVAAFERDDLGIRARPEAEDTIGATWSAATVAGLADLVRDDRGRSIDIVAEIDPGDDEVTIEDHLAYLDQLASAIAIAAKARAAMVVSIC